LFRTPDVDNKADAIKLCQKDSKIYNLAEKYCKKNDDCDSPLVDIRVSNTKE